MYLLGYSLNNLSLMALTISTGFVVDDAIVMIENISRFIEEGESPLRAALLGSEQIGFTIVSLTVSLIAVLIPLLFMGDIVGRLFREFAVTLAVTILVSAFVSLTLTPMMCAVFLKHKPRIAAGLVLQRFGTVFRADHRGVRTDGAVGPEASADDAGHNGRNSRGNIAALCHRSERLLSRAGHGRDPRDHGGGTDDFVRRDGRASGGARTRGPDRSGRAESLIVHRRGRNEPDHEHGPHSDQPQTA